MSPDNGAAGRPGAEPPRPRRPVDEEDDAADAVQVPIEDALDLHTFAPRDVASVVDEYLREACRRGYREVRVIHGRGTGTQRRLVQSVLSTHPAVAAFMDAPPERGGWGATVVTLRAEA